MATGPDVATLPHGRHGLDPREVAEHQRRRLIAATTEVVAGRGYQAATITEIAASARVSRRTVYALLGDKEACLVAAYEDGQNRLLGAITLSCYTTPSPDLRLDAALGAILDLLASWPALARLVAVEAPLATKESAAAHDRWLRRYATMLAVRTRPSSEPKVEESVARAGIDAIAAAISRRVSADDIAALPNLLPELLRFRPQLS